MSKFSILVVEFLNKKDTREVDHYSSNDYTDSTNKYIELLNKYAFSNSCFKVSFVEYKEDYNISVVREGFLNENLIKSKVLNKAIKSNQVVKKVKKEIFLLPDDVAELDKKRFLHQTKMGALRDNIEEIATEVLFQTGKYYEEAFLEFITSYKLPAKKEMKRTSIYLESSFISDLEMIIRRYNLNMTPMDLASCIAHFALNDKSYFFMDN